MGTGNGSEFVDKVVLVTGGATNLGQEISRAYASVGAKLSISYFTNFHEAENLAKEFETSDTEYLMTRSDVGDEADIVNLVKRTIEKFGRIDILINNSAVHRDRMVWKLPLEDWDSVLKTNLTGPFMCIREVLLHMRRQQYGRIINIGSVVSRMGVIGAANYASAKAGLEGLTRSVALEVANKGITVNLIALGYINCGMTMRLPEEYQKQILSRNPMGRFGDFKEMMHTVFFLAARDAAYITGQTIHLNGGIYMGG